MSWTDERVALLKKLWVEGKTAAEIAKELGITKVEVSISHCKAYAVAFAVGSG